MFILNLSCVLTLWFLNQLVPCRPRCVAHNFQSTAVTAAGAFPPSAVKSVKVSVKKRSHDVAKSCFKQTQEEFYPCPLFIGPSPCFITSCPHVTSQHARANPWTRSAGACKLNLRPATPVQSDRVAWRSYLSCLRQLSLGASPFLKDWTAFHNTHFTHNYNVFSVLGQACLSVCLSVCLSLSLPLSLFRAVVAEARVPGFFVLFLFLSSSPSSSLSFFFLFLLKKKEKVNQTLRKQLLQVCFYCCCFGPSSSRCKK